MRLFRRLLYHVPKGDGTIDLLDRALAAAAELGWDARELRFYLSDSAHRKTSVVRDALRRFPTLERFRYTSARREASDRPSPLALSNLGSTWDDPHPVLPVEDSTLDVSIARELAAGIPRAYPFLLANFILDRVRWQDSGPEPGPAASGARPPSAYFPMERLSSSIVIRGDWWTSGRQLALGAIVEIGPPPFAEAAPAPLPSRAASALARLGKVSTEDLVALPDEAERKAIREACVLAHLQIDEVRSALAAAAARLTVAPGRTGSLAEANATPDGAEPSLKRHILKAFSPRGYEHKSRLGLGTYRLAKRRASHNQVQLAFDYSATVGALTLSLAYRGLGWRHELDVPTNAAGSARASDPELERAIQAAAAQVDRLECGLLDHLDRIHGPSPAWLAALE